MHVSSQAKGQACRLRKKGALKTPPTHLLPRYLNTCMSLHINYPFIWLQLRAWLHGVSCANSVFLHPMGRVDDSCT